jgi:hypothetical protein
MDDNNATWLILLALVALGAAVFLFAGTGPEQAMPGPAASTTLPVVSAPRVIQAPRSLLPPTVDAGMNFTIDERGSVRLHGEGRDPSGGMLIYHWTAEGGRGYWRAGLLQQRPLAGSHLHGSVALCLRGVRHPDPDRDQQQWNKRERSAVRACPRG